MLCVGRLVEYKGVQHAIGALERLPEYDLIVAGAGPYRETLEALAADRGLSDRVEFPGFVDHDRLPGLYAGAEALCALSSFEAYGLTVQEALAAGTPCVVRPRGGLQQWVGRPGCVAVEGVSPERVAAGVREAVGSKVGREGLVSWEEMGERLVAIYRGCLGGE